MTAERRRAQTCFGGQMTAARTMGFFRFSVLVQPEGGTISHSLATALVDANGRIVEIWRGNGWKPDEVRVKISETKK